MRLPGKRGFYQMRAGPGVIRKGRDASATTVIKTRRRAQRPGSVVREGRGGPGGLALRFLPVPVSLHVAARHVLAGKSQAAGVLTQEPAHEDGGGELAEMLLLDRLQVGAPDLRLLGDGLERQAETLSFFTQIGSALGRRSIGTGRGGLGWLRIR